MNSAEHEFAEVGFIAESAWPELRRIAHEQAPTLAWARGIAARAWRRQYEFRFSSDDRVAHVRYALYAKAVSTAQGAIVLLELGMAQQAEALTRVAFEACFVLGAITNDETAANHIVAAHHASRRKRINRSRQVPELASILAEHKADLDKALSDAYENLQDSDLIEKPLEQLAKLAGMFGEYTVLYTSLSDSVHSTARDLDRFISSKDGKFDGIENVPDFRSVPTVATMIAQALISVMRMTAGEDVEQEFIEFLAKAREDLHAHGCFEPEPQPQAVDSPAATGDSNQ